MPSTIELVTHILEMDKELENLRIKNMMLSKDEHNVNHCSCDEVEQPSKIDEIIYQAGIESMYKKLFYDWTTVKAFRKENGKVEYTSFQNYVKNELRNECIPLELSKKEVLMKFDHILKTKYEDKCKEAYEKLLKEEQEREEDE
ncbi:hypothetical protein KEC48_03315 [Clostridium sp. C1]|uniref:hypothetical protein n=1 Tax=Clostridium sp. C1 TaxID=1155388 RepID=UPI001BAAD702|nr:hypothetical protein [Clostridium sp. C1]QUN13568.1 hypothetical protein KEC48_03315 [Clostridium sp. C1]